MTEAPRRRTDTHPLRFGEEARLVRQVRSGDRAAFERLFNAYHDRLYDYAAQLTGAPDEAAAIVRSVFERALATDLMLGESSRFSLRLFTIARERILTQLHDTHQLRLPESPDPIRDPAGALREFARQLPEPQQTALHLYLHQGFALVEIGEVLESLADAAQHEIDLGRAALIEAVAGRIEAPVETFAQLPAIGPPAGRREETRDYLAALWSAPNRTDEAPDDFGEPRSVPNESSDPEATIRQLRPPVWLPPDPEPEPEFEPPTERIRVAPPPPPRLPVRPAARRGGLGPVGGSVMIGLVFGILASGLGLAFVILNGGFRGPVAAVAPSSGTPTVAAAAVAVRSATATPTSSPTRTATATLTVTATSTRSASPAAAAAITATATLTPSATATATFSPTKVPPKATASPAARPTMRATAPATATPTATLVVSATRSPATATATNPPATPPATVTAATATTLPATPITAATPAGSATTGVNGSLGARPSQLDFGPTEDGKAVTLSNFGRQPLGWQATTTQPWLSIQPPGGIIPVGEVDALNVAVQRSLLPPGTYRATIAITSDDGRINVPVTVVVR